MAQDPEVSGIGCFGLQRVNDLPDAEATYFPVSAFLTGLLEPDSVWLILPAENSPPTCLTPPSSGQGEGGGFSYTLWTLISTLEDLIPKNLNVLHSTDRVYF